VPRRRSVADIQVYGLVADTIWHPELQKKKVRQALALAVDCPTLMSVLYSNLHSCHGSIAPFGVVGVTPANSAPSTFDPDLARQLLDEAGYDPSNLIRIHTRQGRVFKDVELWEAVASFWIDVGVNAKVQVGDPSLLRDIRRSGCGQLADPLDCHNQPPPGPFFASSHFFEVATSSDNFDFEGQAARRLGCFNILTRVCDPSPGGLEEKNQNAFVTTQGPLRQQRLEELATIAHDEFYFLPMFQIAALYGMGSSVNWEPRSDRRVRVNTMWFTN